MEFDVVLEPPAFTSTEPLAEAVFGCRDAIGQGVVEVGELVSRFNVELLFPSLKGHGGGKVVLLVLVEGIGVVVDDD